jgi:RNA polymerase sigma factor (sigma-70 family)
MGSDQFTFEENVFPVVSVLLKRRLASNPDKDCKLADALSVAWEIHRTAPSGVSPKSIAYFALKSVHSNRQYRESSRSLLSPKRRDAKPLRSTIDIAVVARDGSDPARVAAFRIDFDQWRQSLTDKQRQMVELLIQGYTTQEVAEIIGCSPGNVSQYRRRLAESWDAR